jgi:hypothetical protein
LSNWPESEDHLLLDNQELKDFDQRYNAGRSFVEMAGIDT